MANRCASRCTHCALRHAGARKGCRAQCRFAPQ